MDVRYQFEGRLSHMEKDTIDINLNLATPVREYAPPECPILKNVKNNPDI